MEAIHQCNEITLGNFKCTFTENGDWIYKAVNSTALNKKVSEKPQIKVVEEIEEEYLKEFQKTLENSAIDIAKYLL